MSASSILVELFGPRLRIAVSGLLALVGACGRHGFDPALDDAAPADATGASPYAAAVLEGRPLGYWRFDDTTTPVAADSSGNGRDGTYAAALLGRPGALADGNLAAELVDTGGAQVDMGDAFGFEGSAPFTVELWVSPSPTRLDAVLVGKFDYDDLAGTYDGWHIYYNETETTLRRARVNVTAPPIPLGEYSYVAATYDGVTATVYVNGVAGTPRVTAASVPAVVAPFLVGNQAMGKWARHSGLVDELAVYDRALRAEEIAERYRLARP